MASLGGRCLYCVKDILLRASNFKTIYRPGISTPLFTRVYSTTDTNTELEPVAQEIDEDEIARIRDVSRLSDTLKARVRGELPWNLGERPYHFKKNYRRKLLCQHGIASGLDPGSMWPSKQEMKEMISDQAEYEMSVTEMLAVIEEQKQRKERNDRTRETRIAELMSKMDDMIADHHKRNNQKLELQKKQAEKKARLLAEAQEYFGYSVDPRDEKFKQMVADKEAAEKKAEKQRKKAEKLAKMTAQLKE